MTNKKLLVTTLFLTALLLSSVYAYFLPAASAAELTEQKGLNIIENIVGVDLARYTISAKESMPSQQTSYRGVIPQEIISYNLTSTGNSVFALCVFSNRSLQMMYLIQNQGSSYLTKTASSTNALQTVKGFLTNYQTYTGKSLFGELRSSLDNVDANQNFTRIVGDKVLEVNASNGQTNFKWYYSANGAIAPYLKFISIGVNDASLVSFVNNWDFNPIGNTNVALSKQQAVSRALIVAKDHNWSIPLDNDTLDNGVFNENNSVSWSALTFDNSLGANENRSSDVLTLYPVWRVGLVLNKWYGYLYGIEVDIWADTGQISL